LTALHVANAIEHSLAEPNGAIKMDTEYPAELRIVEQLDYLRDLVQSSGRTKSGTTQFMRKMAGRNGNDRAPVQQSIQGTAAKSESGDSPNGFWTRFRGLLAT
jgi:hypothetical protein